MAKHLSGNASPEEASELEVLMKRHPELSFAAQHVADLWKLKGGHNIAEAEEAFKKHLQALEKEEPGFLGFTPPHPGKRRAKRNAAFLVFSAVALFLLAGGWLVWTSKKSEPFAPQRAEVWTRPGSRTKLILPDSTVVWLNGDSKLTYDRDFGTGNRNTVLAGEAFFDVKKGTIPFIIEARSIRIRVLGTAFNVKCYANEKTTETSVIRGRVEVSMSKRPGEPFVVKPNEKLIVANDEGIEHDIRPTANHSKQPIVVLKELTHITDSTILETSWVENKLIFQDETLEEVARKMERWYNVKIAISDEKLAAMRVGGGPFEKESISQALVALQIAFNFKFSIKGNQIMITP